jgi:hypothetical protein
VQIGTTLLGLRRVHSFVRDEMLRLAEHASDDPFIPFLRYIPVPSCTVMI